MRRLITLAFLLLAATAGMLALTRPAAGQLPDAPMDDIVVGSADAIRFENVTASSSLNTVLNGVGARVAVEFANAVAYPLFTAPPAQLDAQLAQTGPRVAVEFANAARHANLSAPTGVLATALAQAGPRVVFEFANANRSMTMAYPKALINDTAAPVIGQPRGSGNRIAWATDEFTSIVFRYGTTQTQLDQQIVDEVFSRSHEVTLPTVQPGVIYYYQITATDLSGNTATSPIYEYRSELRLYLPSVLKR